MVSDNSDTDNDTDSVNDSGNDTNKARPKLHVVSASRWSSHR